MRLKGRKCYPTLKDLPKKQEVVMIALALKNTVNVIPVVKGVGADIEWFPPNNFDGNSINLAEQFSLNLVSNVCPIGHLRKINNSYSRNRELKNQV